MNNKSWKTTACGIALIVITIANAVVEYCKTGTFNYITCMGGITGGIAAIKAKDATVTGISSILVAGLFLTSCASIPGLPGAAITMQPDGSILASYTDAAGTKYQAGPQLGSDGKIASYILQWTNQSGVTIRASRAAKGNETKVTYLSNGQWLAWDNKSGVSLGSIPAPLTGIPSP